LGKIGVVLGSFEGGCLELFHAKSGNFGVNSGNFGVNSGSFGYVLGSFGVVLGSLGMDSGSFEMVEAHHTCGQEIGFRAE
jgi:hypothetical protein